MSCSSLGYLYERKWKQALSKSHHPSASGSRYFGSAQVASARRRPIALSWWPKMSCRQPVMDIEFMDRPPISSQVSGQRFPWWRHLAMLGSRRLEGEPLSRQDGKDHVHLAAAEHRACS